MFKGIYCKEKNSNTVHESILIDNFNNCINSALNSQLCSVDLSDSKNTVEMSTVSNLFPDFKVSSSEVQVPIAKKDAGTNVRAIYSEDGIIYEAVIEKRLDDNLAIVRFHGYDNEEIVNVNSLLPSLGNDAIKEQIELSKLEEIPDFEKPIGHDESIQKEINWKIGMACRALYEKNDTIYEAVVIKINDSERTALVEMIGYGVQFEAKFENMYESIHEYRVKQEISAKKYINLQEKSSKKALLVSDCRAQLEKNDSSSTDFETKVHKIPGQLKEPRLNNTVNESTDVLAENHPLVPFPTIGILQPENESEALACLVSANYLSGYYAGYYDCIRKRQNSCKSQS